MKTIRIKSAAGARIRNGYPLVFQGDLLDEGHRVVPGFPMKLVNESGDFVALGVGDQRGPLVVRVWSHNPSDQIMTSEFLEKRFLEALSERIHKGYRGTFRVCFSESDGLSGWVVDRYERAGSPQDAFQALWVFQVANPFFLQWEMDWDRMVENLENFYQTHVKLEAKKEPPCWLMKAPSPAGGEAGLSWRGSELDALAWDDLTVKWTPFAPINSPLFGSSPTLKLVTDVLHGQKTGLFLDQSENLFWLAKIIKMILPKWQGNRFRVIDLCCYRGAWSTQIISVIKQEKPSLRVEVVLVDQSERALQHARINVERAGADQVKTFCGDVFHILDEVASERFSVVVCDPPAFAKSRAQKNAAIRGYRVLNSKALRILDKRAPSIFVSCSCTQSVGVGDFEDLVLREVQQFDGGNLTFFGRGGQPWDHPVRSYFPEAHYLKAVFWANW